MHARPHFAPVLTAAQLREVDRRTIELGIPGIVLMENAGSRVVDFLVERFSPLASQRIVVVCGKGNNGGDGFVIARQLLTRFAAAELHVVLIGDPSEISGDAALNLRMFAACGGTYLRAFTPQMGTATLVIDAMLGTGLRGPATGMSEAAIRHMATGFPMATIISVDIPSGVSSDDPSVHSGAQVPADFTVTFTARKLSQSLYPALDGMGELHVVPIGTPVSLLATEEYSGLLEITPEGIAPLFRPRQKDSNKGLYGHVLVIAGSRGKPGAAAMAGTAALRAGAGLVTVATAGSSAAAVAAYTPELMTEAVAENADGHIAATGLPALLELASKRTVAALGPGLGNTPEVAHWVTEFIGACPHPMVVDADALNAIAFHAENVQGRGRSFPATQKLCVVTPHPGEMARLTGKTVADVQADRVGNAREYAVRNRVLVVLKGQRTVIAFPDGNVWINPTGSPAMAKGGSGDVLTGLIAGFLAQYREEPELAVAAAVYLHGRAGELGEKHWGERSLLATELLDYLPAAVRELPTGVRRSS